MRVHVLYTLAENGTFDNLLAAFTDEGLLNKWAADWLSKNPKQKLYGDTLLLNPSPRVTGSDTMEGDPCIILHTVNANYETDHVHAAFTDVDCLALWVEDWIKINPHKELFYITVPLNPKT